MGIRRETWDWFFIFLQLIFWRQDLQLQIYVHDHVLVLRIAFWMMKSDEFSSSL